MCENSMLHPRCDYPECIKESTHITKDYWGMPLFYCDEHFELMSERGDMEAEKQEENDHL